MLTPLRHFNSLASTPQHTSSERDRLRSLRDLPKSRYATRPCITIIQPRRPRPLVFSHIEVYKMVESIATELREAGVRPQTACAFVLPNSIESIVYFLALQWIGAVAVPIDPLLDQPLLQAMLTSVSALTVVSPFVDEEKRDDDELYQKVSNVCEQGHHVHWMINRSINKGVYLEMCGRRAGQQSAWAGGAGDFRFESSDTSFHLPSVHPAAGLSIQISHGVAADISRLFVDNYQLSEENSTLLVLPLYYVHGLMSVLTTLTSGGNIVIADKTSLNVDTIVKHISTLRLNWLTADANLLVPLFSKVISDIPHPTSSPLSSLSFIRCVGGSIDKDLLDKVTPLLGGPILQSYGTTETCGLVTTNIISNNKLGTFGKPVGTIEVCIFDEESRQLVRPGNVGLIGVYGGHVDMSSGLVDKNVKETCFADENDKSFFLTGDKGRIDEEGFLCISSLTSRDSESTALIEMLQAKMNEHKHELEVAAREMEEKRKALEEEELGSRKEVEEELEKTLLEAEEHIKEEEDQRLKEEEEHRLKEEEELRLKEEEEHRLKEEEEHRLKEEEELRLKEEEEHRLKEEEEHRLKEEEEHRLKEEEDQRLKEEEDQRLKEEEEERRLNEEEGQNFGDSASLDEESFKDSLQHSDEISQNGEEAEHIIISPKTSSDSKDSESSSERITIDQPQIEHIEDKEDGLDVATTDGLSLNAESDREFDTEPYVLHDLLCRMNKMEQRQEELEEELEEARSMNNIFSRLETVEGNMKDIKVENSDNTEVEVSDSTSFSGEDSDEVVEAERKDSDEETNEEDASIDEIEKVVGAQNSNSDLSERTSDELDCSGSGENNTTSISLAPVSSSDVNSISAGSRLNSTSTLNKNTSGTGEMRNSDSDSGTRSIDESERKVVEDNHMLKSRLEVLEAYVRKIDESSSDGILSQEMSNRLGTIEGNQSRVDEDEEKEQEHPLEMGEMQALLQKIESSQKMQLSVTQKCISLITSASRSQLQHTSPSLDFEGLARAVRQAAASASKSSRDTKLAATAAREAATAAKSATDAHAALLRKPSGDDGKNDVDLKKTVIVSLDDIERAIMTHPSVKTARAFGVPDRKFSMECYCVVDLKAGARVSETWLKLHAQSSLPAACVPKSFFCKEGLGINEDRDSLAMDKDLINILQVTGNTKERLVKSPTWAPRFRKRRSNPAA